MTVCRTLNRGAGRCPAELTIGVTRTPAGPFVRDVRHNTTGNPIPVVEVRWTDAAADQAPGIASRPTRGAPPRIADTAGPASTPAVPDEPSASDATVRTGAAAALPVTPPVLAKPIALSSESIGCSPYIAKLAGTVTAVTCDSGDSPDVDGAHHDGDASRCSTWGTVPMSRGPANMISCAWDSAGPPVARAAATPCLASPAESTVCGGEVYDVTLAAAAEALA